jgi:hypothetical protein
MINPALCAGTKTKTAKATLKGLNMMLFNPFGVVKFFYTYTAGYTGGYSY